MNGGLGIKLDLSNFSVAWKEIGNPWSNYEIKHLGSGSGGLPYIAASLPFASAPALCCFPHFAL